MNPVKYLAHYQFGIRKIRLPNSLRIAVLAILISAAVLPAIDASYKLLKAKLAQQLIGNSWQKSLATGKPARPPWPWADTVPVAMLNIPAVNIKTWVLSGSSGTSLAFGPGMVAGSVQPGLRGVSVIGAHRDTHFKHLDQVKVGDVISLQNSVGLRHQYRTTHISIADIRTDKIRSSDDKSRLLLVTYYPFNAIATGGPLRYVLEAELVSGPQPAATSHATQSCCPNTTAAVKRPESGYSGNNPNRDILPLRGSL